MNAVSNGFSEKVSGGGTGRLMGTFGPDLEDGGRFLNGSGLHNEKIYNFVIGYIIRGYPQAKVDNITRKKPEAKEIS